ncbi:MAG: MarC family protein [Thermoplasmatota archaeon]
MIYLDAFLAIFIPLLIIVNPASTLALFSAITNNYSKTERKITAKNTVKYAAILLLIFAFSGSLILEYLGIEIYSLRIAGGILLAFVGLDMTRHGKQFGESKPEKDQKADYSIVPLAMPSLAGPGAITVIIVSMKILRNTGRNGFALSWIVSILLAIFAIILVMIIAYIIFICSTYIIKIVGNKGMDAFSRVMGLLTVAIAVQFMFIAMESWLLSQGIL